MTAKLKIDLTQGILEVEGSETFVKAIYNDFKAQFVQGEGSEAEEVKPAARRRRVRKNAVKTRAAEPAAVPVEIPAQPAGREEPPPAKVVVPAPTYARLKDLHLGATKEHSSLVEFMDAKLPITNEERNLVFLYFLQHLLHLSTITIDHVYTCYREANIRAPLNLEHSLRSTANQKDWIQINDNGHLAVTPEGKLYVEKQLPKKVKS